MIKILYDPDFSWRSKIGYFGPENIPRTSLAMVSERPCAGESFFGLFIARCKCCCCNQCMIVINAALFYLFRITIYAMHSQTHTKKKELQIFCIGQKTFSLSLSFFLPHNGSSSWTEGAKLKEFSFVPMIIWHARGREKILFFRWLFRPFSSQSGPSQKIIIALVSSGLASCSKKGPIYAAFSVLP